MTYVISIECAIPAVNRQAANKALRSVVELINKQNGEDVVYFDNHVSTLAEWDSRQPGDNYE